MKKLIHQSLALSLSLSLIAQALTGRLALSVTDATGRVVFQTMLNGEQRQYPLYVTGWAPGAYMLVLRGADGPVLHRENFVVTP